MNIISVWFGRATRSTISSLVSNINILLFINWRLREAIKEIQLSNFINTGVGP